MKDIGLRQVADGQAAARHLGVPVACYPKCDAAFIRPHEAWLRHRGPDGDRWLITATAGTDLYRPDDMVKAAILGNVILGAAGILGYDDSAAPFGPPAPEWRPHGALAVPVTGGGHITYTVLVQDRVVVTAVPDRAAPPPEFGWCSPAG